MHRHSFRLDRLDFLQVILENSDVISKNAELNYFLLSLTRWLCIGYISDVAGLPARTPSPVNLINTTFEGRL